MSQRSQKSRDSSNGPTERRKSARIASNRIIDEITIGTTSADDAATNSSSGGDIELLYENLTASQKKARKSPPPKKKSPAPTPTPRPVSNEPIPSTSRGLSAGELVVWQQQHGLVSQSPSPEPSTSKKIKKTPLKTPKKMPKKPAKKHNLDWVKDRMKQRNLRLEKIISVVDAEEEVQFIVKWKKLPQPERIGFTDLRSIYPKESLNFILSKMRAMTQVEFAKYKSCIEC